MADAFDPWYTWLGIPPSEQPPNHYRLLGVRLFEDNADVIENAADRQMAHLRTFQTSKHGKFSQQLLNDMSAAKLCILNPQKKANYDAALRERLAAITAALASAAPHSGVMFHGGAIPAGAPLPPAPPVSQGAVATLEPHTGEPDLAELLHGSGGPSVRRVTYRSRRAKETGVLISILAVAVIGIAALGAYLWNRYSAEMLSPTSPGPSEKHAGKEPHETIKKSPAGKEGKPSGGHGNPKSTALINSSQWAELRSKVWVKNDAVAGEWKRSGLALTVAPAASARLMLPVMIRESYDLEIDFVHQQGQQLIGLILPVADRMCVLLVDTKKGRLEGIAGDDSSGVSLVSGQAYTLHCQAHWHDDAVTIEVLVNKAPLLHWSGKLSQLSAPAKYELSEPKRPALFADQGAVVFNSVRYRSASGASPEFIVRKEKPRFRANTENVAAGAEQPEEMDGKEKTGDKVQPLPVLARPEKPKAKLAVPSEADQQRAMKMVKDVYTGEIEKANTADLRRMVIQKLLTDASETEKDPIGRFVMMKYAVTVAIQQGDAALAVQAVDKVAAEYQCDAPNIKANALDAVAKATKQLPQFGVIADLAAGVAEEAAVAGDADASARMSKLALQAATKAHEKDLLHRVRDRVKELESLQDALAKSMEAQEKLAKNPKDPVANLIVGKFQAFSANRWEEGLPKLAAGSDPTLKALAAQELSNVVDAAEQLKLADGWREVSEKEDGLGKRNLQTHAASWYATAAPGVTGLDRTKAEKYVKLWSPNTLPVAIDPAGHKGGSMMADAGRNDEKGEVVLTGGSAETHGSKIAVKNGAISDWTDIADYVQWKFDVKQGIYQMVVVCSYPTRVFGATGAGATCTALIESDSYGKIWEGNFPVPLSKSTKTVPAGRVQLTRDRTCTLTLRIVRKANEEPIHIQSIQLIPIK